ncbi:MAG: DUF86 domain-containing protein [Clostridia bacterium]|jgi:nucleotidyltransferase substrate binding protein (TIGR01987 family)|nr:DUF86 domain-containing protein [Clostridia bacterium]
MEIINPDSIERDAAIQRFEFTFETIWKTAKDWLYVREGLDIGSPKSVIRACREVGIFTDEEALLALEMVNDRNLTVHTYNEALAVEIYSRLTKYLPLMEKWLREINLKN